MNVASMASEGSVATSQLNVFVPRLHGPELHGAGLADVARNLLQFSQLDEFIPVGIATGFGHNARLTLKMLQRFANIPHVLVFGRLQLSNATVCDQTIEFIPVAVATSFGNGESAPLKMLGQHLNIPHVLCFGRLKSDTDSETSYRQTDTWGQAKLNPVVAELLNSWLETPH